MKGYEGTTEDTEITELTASNAFKKTPCPPRLRGEHSFWVGIGHRYM